MPPPPPQARAPSGRAKGKAQARSALHAGHIPVPSRKRPVCHVVAAQHEYASPRSRGLAFWVPATVADLARPGRAFSHSGRLSCSSFFWAFEGSPPCRRSGEAVVRRAACQRGAGVKRGCRRFHELGDRLGTRRCLAGSAPLPSEVGCRHWPVSPTLGEASSSRLSLRVQLGAE